MRLTDFKGRQTFAILKVTLYKNKTKKTENKRDELLRLEKEFRDVIHRSQHIKDGKERLVKHTDNQKILADFVAERIEDRKIVNPRGHEQDFTRALLVIEVLLQM